jgi:hypothetical protein
MASNVSVGVNGTTITVVITVANVASYDPANAVVQVMNNSSGTLLTPTTDTTSGGGTIRTLTYTGTSGTGYTVSVTCGGEVMLSSVTISTAKVAVR